MYKALTLPKEFTDLWEAPVVFSTPKRDYAYNPITKQNEMITSIQDWAKQHPLYISMSRDHNGHDRHSYYYIYDRPEQNAIDIYYANDLYLSNIKDVKPSLKEQYLRYNNRRIGWRYFLTEHKALALSLKDTTTYELGFILALPATKIVDEFPDGASFNNYCSAPRVSWLVNCRDLRYHSVSLDMAYSWCATRETKNCLHPDSFAIIQKLYNEPQATRFLSTNPWSNLLADDGEKRKQITLNDIAGFMNTQPYKKTLQNTSDLCKKVTQMIKVNGNPNKENLVHVIKDDNNYGVVYQTPSRVIVYDINKLQCCCYDIAGDKWVSGDYQLFRNTLQWENAKEFDKAVSDELTKIDPDWDKDLEVIPVQHLITRWLKWPAWAKKNKVDKYIDGFKVFWKQKFLRSDKDAYQYIDTCNMLIQSANAYVQQVLLSCAEENKQLSLMSVRTVIGDTPLPLFVNYFNADPIELAYVIPFCNNSYGQDIEQAVNKYLNKYYSGIRTESPESKLNQLVFLAHQEDTLYACKTRIKVDEAFQKNPSIKDFISFDKNLKKMIFKIYDKKPNYLLLLGTYNIKYKHSILRDANLESQIKEVENYRAYGAHVQCKRLTTTEADVIFTFNDTNALYNKIVDGQDALDEAVSKGLYNEIQK